MAEWWKLLTVDRGDASSEFQIPVLTAIFSPPLRHIFWVSECNVQCLQSFGVEEPRFCVLNRSVSIVLPSRRTEVSCAEPFSVFCPSVSKNRGSVCWTACTFTGPRRWGNVFLAKFYTRSLHSAIFVCSDYVSYDVHLYIADLILPSNVYVVSETLFEP